MVRRITIITLVLLLAACKFGAGEKPKAEVKESPVLASLKDSGLPCFNCHSYEKFALDAAGRFSHPKHTAFDIHCNQCHLIKAHNESSIKKDACNRCHNLSSFTYTSSGMPVIFSHQGHAKRATCADCHPKLFVMKQGGTKILMDAMYKGGVCGKCHDGKTAFASTDCAKCHKISSFSKDLTYPSGGLNPAVFSHKAHTAMFECSSCHVALFKYKRGGSGIKMDEIYQGKHCGSCHNGQMAFGSMECQRCHK